MGNCASYRESPAEPEGKFYRFFEKYVNFIGKHGNNNEICGIQGNVFLNFVEVAVYNMLINYAHVNYFHSINE